ncbi:hypothetical protein QFC20_003064 [Naganishia adeliensis]|uniref:Uncharacterized protein n=1 Tax=Naganishia adeliensis TaxID=92952 RepID=A0ACC2WDZ7_9TREE|nr:hypothetical protein QFC20_003064 [Naganishia adeliensis]
MPSKRTEQEEERIDRAAYHRLLAHCQELQARMGDPNVESGEVTSDLTSNRALIYNYQSPSTLTVNHGSSRYPTASMASNNGGVNHHPVGGSGESTQAPNVISGASAISGVGLTDTLRALPRNSAFTSNAPHNRQAGPSRPNPRQAPQFQPNYSIEGKAKANSKPTGPGTGCFEDVPPKGKPLQLGEKYHCRSI